MGGGDKPVRREERVEVAKAPLPLLLENDEDIGRAGLRGDIISKDMLLGVPGVGEGGTLPPEEVWL